MIFPIGAKLRTTELTTLLITGVLEGLTRFLLLKIDLFDPVIAGVELTAKLLFRDKISRALVVLC